MKGKPALVVGGGTLAARKADLLIRAGCDLTVVAAEPGDDLARLIQEHQVKHKESEVTADDVSGCLIVFGASPDAATNRHLHDLATAAGVLANISDTSPAGHPLQKKVKMPEAAASLEH